MWMPSLHKDGEDRNCWVQGNGWNRPSHERSRPSRQDACVPQGVSIERGRPYGDETWVRETAKELGEEQTIRPEGCPRKASGSATGATS